MAPVRSSLGSPTASPEHDVQGVEIRPDLLDRAGARGCRAVPGDAYALPLPNDSCGTVVLRFVLQHLTDPRAAVREAARVLQPGGRLVVIDVDGGMWGCVTPTFPEFNDIYTRFAAAQAQDGGDRMIGRKASGSPRCGAEPGAHRGIQRHHRRPADR